MTAGQRSCWDSTPLTYQGYCTTPGIGEGPPLPAWYPLWLAASPFIAAGCVLGGCVALLTALGEASLMYGLGIPVGTTAAATTAAAGAFTASALSVPVLTSLDTIGAAASGAGGSLRATLSNGAGGFGESIGHRVWRPTSAGSAADGGGAGFVDSATVRFSQDSVSPTFSTGGSISSMASALRGGLSPSEIPSIRIVVRDGQWFTLDNRRLVAFQQAGMAIQYRMATPAEIAAEAWKFTTTNGGTSIIIRQGGGTWP